MKLPNLTVLVRKERFVLIYSFCGVAPCWSVERMQLWSTSVSVSFFRPRICAHLYIRAVPTLVSSLIEAMSQMFAWEVTEVEIVVKPCLQVVKLPSEFRSVDTAC